MINNLSRVLAFKLYNHKVINKDDIDLLSYSFFLIFSYVIYAFICLSCGLIFHCVLESIIFYFFFSLLRMFTGGFHASTPKKCKYYSVIWTMAGLILVRFHWTNQLITECVLLISWLVLMVISPVESRNRRLNIREKKIFGLRARVIATAESAVAVILMLLHLYSFGYALAVAVFMCALMGILGMWSEKRGKTDR